MKEKWSLYASIHIPDGKYELINLQQDGAQFQLTYADEIRKIIITYKEELLAFRSCDEGDRWKTVDNVLGENGGTYFKNKLFLKVQNSDFKKWFMQESFFSKDENKIEHHAFVTANDITDVLAFHAPIIQVIEY